MKILITGKTGYIAKSIHSYLKSKYKITIVGRSDFDLTDPYETLKYFSDKYFDVVIHCAVSGGSRLKHETWRDLDDNLKMYYNLLNCKNKFSKLINFGSGAEINASETPYGLSKKVIANSISEQDNFYNIRIFAVFDENEWETRFIKANIKRYINKEPIIIHRDKYMDFFYMKDLVSLVEFYILNSDVDKQIDCSYSTVYKLSDIANMINELDSYKVDIIVENKKMDNPYIRTFNTMSFNKFFELKHGIIEVFNKLNL